MNENPRPQTLSLLATLNGMRFEESLEVIEEALIVVKGLKQAHDLRGVLNVHNPHS